MFKTKLKHQWHLFWVRFHHAILESCIDYKEREKITRKILYHKIKLNLD